uniref:Vomeronasal type-2 receptor 26-like n=1 Tax=Pogona vitticeps TaxID=103695 RepID=A0ABM5GQ95_9SAUR
MTQCYQCPEDQHPNKEQDACILKDITSLSSEKPLGVALTIFALSLSFITVVVLGIFIKHHKTPIVKANNRNLSYTLLTSLLLSFLSSLLFVGQPKKVTCLLRPILPFVFSLALACVLAKNVMVALAFRAKSPGRWIQKCLGKRLATSIVLACSLTQGTMCLVWLMTSPPFLDLDVHSRAEEAIIVCNTGSVTIAFCVLGFLIFLSILSLTVAFLARTLPDSFNEAKFVTFSIVVFCTVWLCYLLVNFSIKGRNFMAFQVFSMLAFGAALLGCIFFPKCYIIVLRPDLNKREQLVKSQNQRGF